jgi:hypothetical protein
MTTEETTGRTEETPNEETPNEETTFTQKDLDKYAGTARKEGRKATERELAEKLGVSIEEAQQIVRDYRDQQEKQKTELDREKEARQKAEKAAAERERKANERIIASELRLALAQAGINPERMKLALKFADTSEVKVDDEGNVEGIEAVAEAVKDASPEWFGEHYSAPDLSKKDSGVPRGLDAQIQEALEKGDYITAERLQAQKIMQAG